MANQNTTDTVTPEQMLKLAKIVEPDKGWLLCNFKRDVFCTNGLGHITFYDPENDPDQLMEVVFALLKFGWGFQFKQGGEGWLAKIAEYKGADKIIYECRAKTKEQAIINLAIEVLL